MKADSLKTTMQKKWHSLSLQEQGVLLFGAGFLLVFLLWFAVIQPVQSTVAQQESRNQAAETSLQRVKQMAGQLKQQQATSSGPRRTGTNLNQLVDNSLRQNNLKMSGFQPGSDGSVALRFDNVSFTGLLQWLYEMEVGQGVIVDELSTRKGSSGGNVAASVRLRMAQ